METQNYQTQSNLVANSNEGKLNKTWQFLKRRKIPVFILLFAIVVAIGAVGFANQQSTAIPGGIYLSIDEIQKLPTSGPAWNNVKSVADGSLGKADISDQTSDHDINTLATALVYARTGDENYRKKAADAVMSAVGTEKGGRTLALAWNLSGYVIAADLINLPQYDSAKDTQFKNWLRAVRNESLDGKTLIKTHEERPNNWGTSSGASRAAADIYLGDKVDLAKAANVFKGYLGDRSAYSGFKYGDLSWQCDPSKPVGINPDGCTRSGIDVGGAIPDDMRRGDSLRYPPASTDYPWTAMQGVAMQAELLSRQGYDSYNWSNKAVKRSVEYLFQLSRKAGSGWWADSDEAWVPWLVNSRYGSNYPTTSNPKSGRVGNFTDWTHANKNNVKQDKDTSAPSSPKSLKADTSVEKNVVLSWGPSTDNVTVTSYQISRDSVVLGYIPNTTFTDNKAEANKQYTYTVKAFDAAGNSSQPVSTVVNVKSSQGDKTKPSVAISQPANNTKITTESIPVVFTASDNIAVTKIELYVDTQLDTSSTTIRTDNNYKMLWNTKSSGNGNHVLYIKAYDSAGNVAESTKVNVIVSLPNTSNTNTPPPSPTTNNDNTNSSNGGTIVIVASEDARVSEDSPDKNYGKEDFLRIRNGSKDWKSYLKFTISGLTSKPSSIKLKLFANDGGPDAGDLFIVSNQWSESSITWRNSPYLTPYYHLGESKNKSVNDQSWTEFDLTNKITQNGTYSFGLQSSDDNSVYFSSREGKNKPTLIIVK